MMPQFRSFLPSWGSHWRWALGAVLLFGALMATAPVQAHHALGGRLPGNAWEGFYSGLAHPIIGIDHLLFVLAVGLLASRYRQGWLIPLSFIAAMLAGAAIRLVHWDLPQAELWVSASVLAVGVLLALPRTLALIWLPVLAGLAGLFHGYAYGESIVGAEMNPLWAYLLGLGLIQGAIALGVMRIGQLWPETPTQPWLRFGGYAVAGAGLALLSNFLPL